MANTFIQLNDTPSEYTGNVQYLITAGNQIDFVTLSTNELVDVNTLGAYAPENGQVLQWFGGAEEFRPASVDPYSAGNGLSKSDNLTLNVNTLSGGGLAANASGLFLETVPGVAGTYGNTTHVPSITVNDKGQIIGASFVAGSFEVANSLTANHIRNIAGTAGQIVVTGGTGVAANSVVGLVATGVTAGTYGNATYSPIITVDTYGRIQNVDLVENIGGGGGDGNVDLSTVTTEAFKSIVVSGQTTISAESKDDTLTFVAGTGMAITTNAGTDTITFESTGGGASVTVSDTAPVGASAGDLWWDSSTGKLKIYYDDLSSQQWVDASPASGTSADYSEGALILPNSQTPAVDEGSITWDPVADTLYVGDGTSAVAISGAGGSYGDADVQTYLDAQGYSNVDSDSQTLSWDEANTALSISGGNTVTITGFTNYADSDVNSFLTANGYSNTVVSYSNTTVQSYLDAQGYSNVDSDSQTLTWDAANVNLAISGGNNVTLFDQSLDSTDTVTFNQVNTEDVTGANQLILSAGASGITASTNGNQQFNATSGSIFLVTPTVDAQESEVLANVATANVVAFNTTGGITAGVGEMTWNATDATVDLGLGTATLQIGQEEYVYAKATEDIDNGDVVMIVGALGSRLRVAKANVNAPGFKLSSVVGVATQAITNNTDGYITTFGKVRGINTNTFTDGDTVYLSDTTAGALVNVEPSASIIIGTVADASVNGTLFVKEFIDSQTLTWDSANSNLSISGGNTVTITVESANTAISALTSETTTRTVIAAETLAKGDAVYISGGTGDNPEVSKADADDPAKMPVFGITAEAVTASNTTEIVIYGELTSYDTTGFATGDSLFVSGTPGILTNVKPTGENNLLQTVGKVIKGNSTGGKITITGAGRTNATPNLNEGNIFIGNASNVAVSSSLNSAVSALGYAQISGGTLSADSVETANVQPVAVSTDSVDGNNLNIDGGNATGLNSTGGDVVINGGVGALANGDVSIGTTSTVAITIGAAGSTNTINGQTTFTNDARFDTGVEEQFSTINAATGTVVHNCDNGHIFRHTAPSANWTANFTNLGLTTSYATTVTLVIDQGVTARIPTAVQIGGVAQTLLWQGGSPPTGTSNGEDVVSFSILNSGGTYTVLGQLVGFS